MARDELVRSVGRALSIVEILNERPATSLEALHQATGVPKSTLIRLLETLIEAGYVLRLSRKEGYAVTESVLRLSAGVRRRDALVDIARPPMEAFTREHKWQISLATYETDSMLVRATTRDISPFSRDENYLNRRCSVLLSVVGRAYFAFCPPAEREFMLEIFRTAGTVDAEVAQCAARVEAIVAKVCRNRYAVDRPGRLGRYRSFAVPIAAPGSGEEILGAMVLFWYGSVMSEKQVVSRYLDGLYDLVGRISCDLSASLAFAAPPPARRVRRCAEGAGALLGAH
jgi:IclR family mhp operon transcriptional activator